MSDLKSQVEAAIMARKGKQQGNEVKFQCPAHDDANPSAQYNVEKACWHCFVCGESGNYWHLARLLGLVNNGHRPDGYRETRRWDIGGVATHKRLDKEGGKKLVEWERDGKPTLGGLKTESLSLYGHVTSLEDDLLINEGEKKTDALLALGFSALGTVCGAVVTPSRDSLKPLAEHRGKVILFADNDDPGRCHMLKIAARLKGMGKTSYIGTWPGVPEKGDAYDFIKAGHTAEDVKVVIASAEEYQGEAETKQFNLTDLGNAERLIHLFGGILRYSHERKKWLVWSGKVWEWDMGEKVAALAKKAVRSIYGEAANEPNEKMRGQLAEHAKRSESGARIEAMIIRAQSEEGVPVKIADLDCNGWLLNVQNGTLDLRNGRLLPHAKEDLLTIILPTEYLADAQCPLWQSMIDRMTDQDREFGAYLQRAVGYTLTADTKQQAWFFLYGLGNNCKSTFTMTLRRLLSDYAERLDAEDLMIHDKGQRGGPKEGIADLRGKRYVVGSEVQNGRHLNVSLLKDMTGGETIKARRLYEHQIEFSPTHKLWLFGNHKPIIGDSTLSIWRRLKLIHLSHTIPDNEIDLDFAQKLEENELPGILAWAVCGCLDWQANGLGQPRRVTDATAAYRHEQDIIGDFLEDCTRFRAGATVIKKALKDAYLSWCEKNSVEPAKHQYYLNALVEKGITDSRGAKGVRVWVGLELSSPMSPESDKKEGENRIQGDTSDKTDAYVPQSPHMRGNLIDFRGTTHENCHPTLEGEKKCHPDPSEDLPPSDPCPRCGKDSWALSEDCTFFLCFECGYERR